MTLSLTAALRVMGWLLDPWHFLLVYSLEVIELGLALVGAAVLLRRALRRYQQALAAITLSAAVTVAPTPPRLPLLPGAHYRFDVPQHRVVRAARRAQMPHRPEPVPPHPPRGATERSTARDVVAAQLDPEQRRVFDAALAAAEARQAMADARTPAAIPAPRRMPVSERQLRVIANDQVIGPMIAACRQAAGGQP